MNRQSHPSSPGFTLLEVIVALAILAISLGALLRIFSNDLNRASETEAQVVANALAQSLLARLGTEEALADGDTAGKFNNGFRWRLRVAPYGDSQDRAAWPVEAHQVTAEVSWLDGGRERSVSLVTLRLAPKAVTP
jgi:general secretion pathway protein I